MKPWFGCGAGTALAKDAAHTKARPIVSGLFIRRLATRLVCKKLMKRFNEVLMPDNVAASPSGTALGVLVDRIATRAIR